LPLYWPADSRSRSCRTSQCETRRGSPVVSGDRAELQQRATIRLRVFGHVLYIGMEWSEDTQLTLKAVPD